MAKPLRVIVIEDTEDDTALLLDELRLGDFEVTYQVVETANHLKRVLAERDWDIIISDYSLPSFSAPAALEILKQSGKDIPFIVVSGTVSESVVVDVMRAGASDYLMKDNFTRLTAAIDREMREAASRRQGRRFEEQLQQSEKMNAVGRLAGGVAHDFNNLLTIVSGYSDLLLDRGVLQGEDKAALQEVKNAAERGGWLTHQLLAFSRQQALNPQVLNLNTLVQNLEKMLRRLIGEDIDLISVLDPNLGMTKVDRGQIEQVILNIVVNSRDAMPSGGKITVETQNVVIERGSQRYVNLKPGPYVLLAISDNGSGMTPAVQSRVFEPFFTTKDAGKGTGLGLSTVYGIVTQSGGVIALYSEPGRGTTMRIYLPQVSESESAEEQREEATLRLEGRETILVVEDEPRLRKLICEVLRSAGYTVMDSDCAQQAIALSAISPETIHMIVSDVVMPDLSGPEMVKQIMPHRPGACILFISGYTDEALVRHGMVNNSASFLAKPFLPRDLLRKVREVLDRAGN